jgi:energy-coupling factor transport system permease protein
MLVTWSYRARKCLMALFDPRARWIFSFAFLFAATQFWDARILAVLFVIAFIWYFSARVPWKETRRAWTFVWFLLFVMIVVNTILTGGGAGGVVPPGGHLVWPSGIPIPFTDWHLHFGLTYERLWFAFCQILRIGAISAVFLIIPFSMDPRLYGVTFRGLGFPDKFAYSMELAFRYVPTIARDFGVTVDAQRARGYEIESSGGGIFKQILRTAPLIVPVTMNSILTGEDVANAMDLRCFGQGPRTWLYKLQYHWLDYALIAFSILLLLTSLVLVYRFNIGDFWVPEAYLNWATGR